MVDIFTSRKAAQDPRKRSIYTFGMMSQMNIIGRESCGARNILLFLLVSDKGHVFGYGLHITIAFISHEKVEWWRTRRCKLAECHAAGVQVRFDDSTMLLKDSLTATKM
jgi:hypothetical protein